MRCGGLFRSFYYKLTVEFAGETIFKTREHFGIFPDKKISCLTRMRVSACTVLLKDEEVAVSFTYDMYKLLITVVMLANPLILTSISKISI